MPSVFTISGPRLRGERCKWVNNGKSGCKIQLCFVGKSQKHPTGWSFIKGTSTCGLKGTSRKRKRKRR